MSLIIGGLLGYYSRGTPVPWAVCASIEAVRCETLRRRGICPAEPRIMIFAPHEAGGLNHEHTYQYAAAANIDTFDWVLGGGTGAPSRQALASHIALTCWRLGCRGQSPMAWLPSHLEKELSEESMVEGWLRAKVRSRRVAVQTGRGEA